MPVRKDLVAALLALLERLTKVPPFSLIALGGQRGKIKKQPQGRETTSGQGIGINRETGSFRVAPQATLCETAGLALKTKIVRDPDAGLHGLLARIALIAPNPAIIPLRSSGGDSDSMAGAGATAPGNATRRNVAGFAAALA